MPGLLEQVRGGADQRGAWAASGGCARGGGGHDVASRRALGGVHGVAGDRSPGIGMTLANDAGPRRNAAAPPSPAAAGSASRSVPAARMPLMVR